MAEDRTEGKRKDRVTVKTLKLIDALRAAANAMIAAEPELTELDSELGDGDSHSWFVGFLADDEHPYAFVTLVERGGYGITVAGAITNGFLQWAVENIE